MTGAEPSGFGARLEVRLASSNKRVKVVTYLISLLRTYQFDTRLAIQSEFNPVQNFRRQSRVGGEIDCGDSARAAGFGACRPQSLAW